MARKAKTNPAPASAEATDVVADVPVFPVIPDETPATPEPQPVEDASIPVGMVVVRS